jgi:hypothetical protein
MKNRGDKQATLATLTLAEAAHRLGVSATWVRKLATSGRLESLHVPGIGRVTTEASLVRFLRTRRRRGRPRKSTRGSAPSIRHLHSDDIEAVLRMVAQETGERFTPVQHHHLVKAGALPRRRGFPEGPEGTKAWLQALRQSWVILARLKAHGIIDVRDRALGLKYHDCYVSDALLNHALFSYLIPFIEARKQMTDSDRGGAAQTHARRPWPFYPGTAEMRPADRAAAFEAMSRGGIGDPTSPEDVARIVGVMGPQARLLPESSKSAARFEHSWSDVFAKGRELDEKIDQVVQSAVMRRDDGTYVCKPLAPPDEMDRAWTMARRAFPPWLLTFDDPKIAARDRMASLARTVAHCLILCREQTKVSALGIAIGSLIATILTAPEEVPKPVTDAVSLILETFNEPPRTSDELSDRLKTANRLIETAPGSQAEKVDARQTIRKFLALGTDSSRTVEERFRILEQLMLDQLNVTPAERATLEGMAVESEDAKDILKD